MPALVRVHCTGDRAIPHRGGEALAAGLPDARLVAIEGVAHLPRADDLERISRRIRDFLPG